MTYQKPRISLTLPPLDAYDALLVVDVLESVIQALWRVHGDHMADILAREGIDTPAPKEAVYSNNPRVPNDNTDIDF